MPFEVVSVQFEKRDGIEHMKFELGLGSVVPRLRDHIDMSLLNTPFPLHSLLLVLVLFLLFIAAILCRLCSQRDK